MSTKPLPNIVGWSFSRWQAYLECPRKAYYKFVMKLKEPSSPALERGTDLHTKCEGYLRGWQKTIHKDIAKIGPLLKELKKADAQPELEAAFDDKWQPVEWFAKNAWCRVKADALVNPVIDSDRPTVVVRDFKSGGKMDPVSGEVTFRDEYPLQLELYGVTGLLICPTAQYARSYLDFIDFGKSIEMEEYNRKDLPKLLKAWEQRVKKMLADTRYKPTPGMACKYCHFRKANKGPCEF